MNIGKKLTYVLLLLSAIENTYAMDMDASYLAHIRKNITQSIVDRSHSVANHLKSIGSFLGRHKLATAAAATVSALALAKTFGINPLNSFFSSKPLASKPEDFSNFWQWKKACDATCTAVNKTPLTVTQFTSEIRDFIAAQKISLANQNNWVKNDVSSDVPLYFYLEKLEVAPETEIAFHGDVHGDIKSLNAFIAFLANKGYLDQENPFKISKPNFKIVMLGDYTDRGISGAEVLYTILQMKKHNPNNFFMVRGNHEDKAQNLHGEFGTELRLKFNDGYNNLLNNTVSELYSKLPVALYVVSGEPQQKDALVCCHGGWEIGSRNVKALLADERSHCYAPLRYLLRKVCYEQLPDDFKECFKKCRDHITNHTATMADDIGYLWNDYQFQPTPENNHPISCSSGRYAFPEQLTKYLLKNDSIPECTLRGTFRAHQHSPETMPRILNQDGKSDKEDAGVAKLWLPHGTQQPAGKLWDGIVCTFSVSPNTIFGGVENYYKHNFDSFGILKTGRTFDDWRLTMHQLKTRQ